MYFSKSSAFDSNYRQIGDLTEIDRPEQRPNHIFERHQILPPKPGHLWQVEKGFFRTFTFSESGDIK
ncbi:MAG: hypothetical protein AAF974_10235, partial [Cyanobacteria bacterium P01_E01_bin.34]